MVMPVSFHQVGRNRLTDFIGLVEFKSVSFNRLIGFSSIDLHGFNKFESGSFYLYFLVSQPVYSFRLFNFLTS
jgi:hypothetical protein